MRVCLVSSELAPFHGWGVGTCSALIARSLRDLGHEVHLLVDDLPGLRAGFEREFPGVRAHVLTREEFGAALAQHPGECTRRPIVVHRRLRALHAEHRFDAIAFNDFYGDASMVVAARRTLGDYVGATIGVILHSPIALLRRINGQHEHPLEISMIMHLEAQGVRGADVLIAPSRAIVEELRATRGFEDAIDESRLVIAPYPIARATAPARHADDAPPEVLFYGRLEARKGPDVLVRAVCALLDEGVDLRLRIVGVDTDCGPGGTSMREHLRRLAGPHAATRVVFMENQARGVIEELVRSAAVCCFPALWDNYPNACLEAMALGACVVTTDGGGMREIIEHGRSGLLARAGDAGDLAANLRAALADGALRARLGEAARARVAEVCDMRRSGEAYAAALARATPRVVRTADAGSVAVIIPVYNLGATLPATLASVEAQTRTPDEVLVIDDGSTDPRTIEVLREVESRGVRVIRQANRGLPAARNAAIRATRSDWVLPLDADDLLAPTFIERCLLAAGGRSRMGLVSSHMACFREDPRRPEVTYVPLGFVREALPASNVASSAIALLRRAAIEDVGGYDETLTAYEDWDLYCRLAGQGWEAAIIPEPLILNRMRPDSMLRTLSARADAVLRARMMERHMHLSPDPSRTARIVLAMRGDAGGRADPAQAAAAIIRENLRYRLADKADALVRAIGVRDVVKRVLLRAEGAGER